MRALKGARSEIDSRGTLVTWGPLLDSMIKAVPFFIMVLRNTSNGTEEVEAAEAKIVADMWDSVYE